MKLLKNNNSGGVYKCVIKPAYNFLSGRLSLLPAEPSITT